MPNHHTSISQVKTLLASAKHELSTRYIEIMLKRRKEDLNGYAQALQELYRLEDNMSEAMVFIDALEKGPVTTAMLRDLLLPTS